MNRGLFTICMGILRSHHLQVWKVIVLLTLAFNSSLNGATCTTTAPGVWDCGTPTGSDDLVVNHDVTIAGAFTLTGTIIVNAGSTLTFGSTFSPSGSSTTIISGTMVVTSLMRLFGNAVVTVSSTGTLNALADLRVGDGGGSVTFNIQAGGVATVGGNFRMDGNETGTIDGNLAVAGNIRMDGSICGIGTITYGGTCSGSGDMCGDTGWCDQSGIILLGPLPIELLFFNAVVIEQNVLLTWATASEEGFDFFTIERSLDAKEFYAIGRVSGEGFSDSRIDYGFYDANPIIGRSFYRLKATDFDGFVEYFEIVSVVFDNRFVKYFPNPITNGQALQVIVSLESDQISTYRLFNIHGDQVLKNHLTSGTYYLQLTDLSSGIYLMVIQYPGLIQSSKLIVE